MGSYSPLKITGNSTGLVQNREEFLLPDDAYPVLNNAYVWRERILKKQGALNLGRLQRNLSSASLSFFSSGGPSVVSVNLFTLLGLLVSQPNASLVPGSSANPIIITIGAPISQTLTDMTGNGTMSIAPPGVITAATINYSTGVLTLTFSGAAGASLTTLTAGYYPNLPVMGIRPREVTSTANFANDETIFFDTIYAYVFNGTYFQEFLPGTTWSGDNFNFFWTTNYWLGDNNLKVFWAMNNVDPIRYTNAKSGTNWVNFNPAVDDSGNFLFNALIMLPLKGQMIALNTTEGTTFNSAVPFTNRIRYAAIGTPFTSSDGTVVTVNINPNAWKSNITGQGGIITIPVNEDILSAGYVRDNLVIYCEHSTWQLRATGRYIQPFQLERVNSELGALGLYSTIQFDTSLVGVGDKGVVECDSYKSTLIDIKIPDLVYSIQNINNGPARVCGLRDFEKRLAYWMFPSNSVNTIYPNNRLVYNYENDSWAQFRDSYTALGNYFEQNPKTWLSVPKPWIECNFSWLSSSNTSFFPQLLGGNQQGFVQQLNLLNSDDVSLMIYSITADNINATSINSPNHNMSTGTIIEIYGIPTGTPFANLNFAYAIPPALYDNVFSIIVTDANNFTLNKYNPDNDQFDIPQLDNQTGYVGGGEIAIRDNFNIQSKKFNFMDEGQSIQMGYLDILMENTGNALGNTPGAISMYVYLDYNVDESSNAAPLNSINQEPIGIPDTFFNTVIPTTQSDLNTKGGTKFWQRVYCPTRANFLTLQYQFSNGQMASVASNTSVQIDAQILWVRRAGRLTQI